MLSLVMMHINRYNKKWSIVPGREGKGCIAG